MHPVSASPCAPLHKDLLPFVFADEERQYAPPGAQAAMVRRFVRARPDVSLDFRAAHGMTTTHTFDVCGRTMACHYEAFQLTAECVDALLQVGAIFHPEDFRRFYTDAAIYSTKGCRRLARLVRDARRAAREDLASPNPVGKEVRRARLYHQYCEEAARIRRAALSVVAPHLRTSAAPLARVPASVLHLAATFL